VTDRINLQRPVDGFHCRPLGTRLRVVACAERHKLQADPTCKRCPVGAAHARGATPPAWADGRPVEKAAILPHGSVDVTRLGSRSRR